MLSSHPQHIGGPERRPGPAQSTQGAQEAGTQLWPDLLQSRGDTPQSPGLIDTLCSCWTKKKPA